MMLLVACLSIHLVLAGAIPSPWWVPNLTLAGLMLAIVRTPRHWLVFSATAAVWMAMWAVRHPVPICLGYLAVGASMRVLAKQWDLSDVRVLCVLVWGASALITYGMLWVDDIWSLPLVGLAMGHVLVTGMSVLAIGHLGKSAKRTA